MRPLKRKLIIAIGIFNIMFLISLPAILFTKLGEYMSGWMNWGIYVLLVLSINLVVKYYLHVSQMNNEAPEEHPPGSI